MNWTDKIKVTNEDNMELMKRYPNNYFDLAIVDPPYGIGAENHSGNKENGWTQWDKKDWDSKPPSKEYFNELFRVSKNQIIWGANHFIDLIPKPFSCFLIWDKGQRNFSLADGELAWTSFKKAARFYTFARAKALKEGKIHPTQKPEQLYKWILDNYAKEGDKILDTHLGSGSIAIACHNLGYELTACELDKEYYEASLKRFKQVTSQQSLF
jgi:site-specific DNA-methyltransferase (adenine-specific)